MVVMRFFHSLKLAPSYSKPLAARSPGSNGVAFVVEGSAVLADVEAPSLDMLRDSEVVSVLEEWKDFDIKQP